MVRRQHHGSGHPGRVEGGDPAPLTRAGLDDRPGADQGPPDVERRHRRDLVRSVGDRLGVVDLRPVFLQGVDETHVGEPSGWGQGKGDMDDQRREGGSEQHPPDPAVVLVVAGVHPHHPDGGAEEVGEEVVAVEQPDRCVARNDEVLEMHLVEDPQCLLEVDDPFAVREGDVDLVLHQKTHGAVCRQAPDQQQELPPEKPSVTRPRRVGRVRRVAGGVL